MNKTNIETQTGTDLPIEHCHEYDGAAEHFARFGQLPEQRVLAALKDAAKLVNDCEHDCDYYISDEALLRREAIESAIAAAEKASAE